MTPDLLGFFQKIWELHVCDIEGSEIEQIATEHGLVEQVMATEPCGEECRCKCYGFPVECLRPVKLS